MFAHWWLLPTSSTLQPTHDFFINYQNESLSIEPGFSFDGGLFLCQFVLDKLNESPLAALEAHIKIVACQRSVGPGPLRPNQPNVFLHFRGVGDQLPLQLC